MAEIKENSSFHGAGELEESIMMPVEKKKSSEENFETPPEEKSEDIELIQLETSEETFRKLGELGDRQQDEVTCPPTNDLSTSESKDWKPGSRCRAVYSDDGLVYPAVVLWVKGQRCCVRYDNYNNEEEHDINSLLTPNELHGPGRVVAFKGSNWKSSANSSKFDWKKRRRDGKQGQRGGQNSSTDNEIPGRQGQVEKEADEEEADEEEKRGNQREEAEKLANHSFPLFPPITPQMGSVNPMSFPSPPPPPPPPPPVWVLCGKEAGDSPDVNTITNMLRQWYMCGFQTGTYMAQQLYKSTLKDEVKSPR